MIQEVVGKKVGKYFLPAFAGVAFSKNEFRWSSRIQREDGLVRLVLGLGTRAVDRLSDDYPVLIAPGQPALRVNVTLEEIIRYSPRKIDVINLETRTFETIEIRSLLENFGDEYPQISKLISIVDHEHLKKARAIGTDFKKNEFVVTFDGLVTETQFVKKVIAILNELEKTYGNPIDIEFAHDGKDFYLLQCRSQSYSEDSQPAFIPANLQNEKIIFSAHRYITNGKISDISNIVYVDPQSYSELTNQRDMLAVGEAIGKLNKVLPRRKFILIGPGRWGSRGDIKLGVNVSYSEINNSAMLIEIARKQKDYVPDLSFGTHFFQDLVEARIRYLPLYPDDEGNIFNEEFLINSKNILPKILPEFKFLSGVIKVIDVPKTADGATLEILMNASSDEAVAILSDYNETK